MAIKKNKIQTLKNLDNMKGGRNNPDSGGFVKHTGFGILSRDLFNGKITRKKFHELLCSFALSFHMNNKDLSCGYTDKMIQGARKFLDKYDSHLLGSDLGDNHLNDYADTCRWYYDEKYSQKHVNIPDSNGNNRLVQWSNYCETWFWKYVNKGKSVLPY